MFVQMQMPDKSFIFCCDDAWAVYVNAKHSHKFSKNNQLFKCKTTKKTTKIYSDILVESRHFFLDGVCQPSIFIIRLMLESSTNVMGTVIII